MSRKNGNSGATVNRGKRSHRRKQFWEMNADELREATKEFDAPLDPSKFRAMSSSERKKFERKDGPGLSLFLRDGGCDVSILLDDDLMHRAKVYARKHKMTLPKMIDRAVRGLLAFSE